MVPSILFVALAHGQDPPSDPETPAPAPVVSSATPTLAMLAGTWYVTSTVDGKEVVGWACGAHPDSFDFDEGHLLIGVGAQSYGGTIASSSVTGTTLVIKTTLEACRSTKNVTVKWVDAAQKILEVTRCTGTPTRVRAVRDIASNIPVMRQCCDPTGKAIRYVGLNDACPPGSTGEKPNPLRR